MLLPSQNDPTVKSLMHRYLINTNKPGREKWAKLVIVETALLIHENGWNCTVEGLLGIAELTIQPAVQSEIAIPAGAEPDSCRYCGADIDVNDLDKRKSLKPADKFCSPGCKSKHQRDKRKS